MPSVNYDRIYAIIKHIPRGRVATYGQIATLAGLGGYARQVGYALHALPDNYDVPWHRVINTSGKISLHSDPLFQDIQRNLLESEGIEFDATERIDLEKYGWKPNPE